MFVVAKANKMCLESYLAVLFLSALSFFMNILYISYILLVFYFTVFWSDLGPSSLNKMWFLGVMVQNSTLPM